MTDPQAESDQEAAKLRTEWAPRLGVYFKALRKEGFQRAEALALVADFQTDMLERDHPRVDE